jgi:pilus assembly protein Flp/PilA
MHRLALKLRQFVFDESGPTAVEYAVMLALIVIACLVSISQIGTEVNTTFSNVGDSLKSANAS